ARPTRPPKLTGKRLHAAACALPIIISNERLNDAMNEIRSSSTREAILDSAEALFARQGHDGTSMRQITSEAGVNLAAVNYHFGSKEALVQAVLKRRLAVLNHERLRLLDELEARAGGQPLKPSQIV